MFTMELSAAPQSVQVLTCILVSTLFIFLLSLYLQKASFAEAWLFIHGLTSMISHLGFVKINDLNPLGKESTERILYGHAKAKFVIGCWKIDKINFVSSNAYEIFFLYEIFTIHIMTFVAIFRRFSTTLRRFSKICLKAKLTFPNICSHLKQCYLSSTRARIFIKVRLLKLSSNNIPSIILGLKKSFVHIVNSAC